MIQVYIKIPATVSVEDGRVTRVECYEDAIELDERAVEADDTDHSAIEVALDHDYDVRAR